MRELLWRLVHWDCCQGNWVLISSGWMPKKTGYREGGKYLVAWNLLEIFSVTGSSSGAHNLKLNCKSPSRSSLCWIQILYQTAVWFSVDAAISLQFTPILNSKWKKKINSEYRSLFTSNGNNTELSFWQLKPTYGEKIYCFNLQGSSCPDQRALCIAFVMYCSMARNSISCEI